MKPYLRSELKKLSGALDKPANSYLRRDIIDFNFEKIKEIQATNSPILWSIFRDLFVRVGVQELASGRPNTNEEDSGDENESDHDHEIEDDDETEADRQKLYSKELIASMGLSVCCYAYSQKVWSSVAILRLGGVPLLTDPEISNY